MLHGIGAAGTEKYRDKCSVKGHRKAVLRFLQQSCAVKLRFLHFDEHGYPHCHTDSNHP